MAHWPWLRLMPGFVIAVLPEKHFRILSAVSPTPLEYVPFDILLNLICQHWYTTTLFRTIKLHQQVRLFATK